MKQKEDIQYKINSISYKTQTILQIYFCTPDITQISHNKVLQLRHKIPYISLNQKSEKMCHLDTLLSNIIFLMHLNFAILECRNFAAF